MSKSFKSIASLLSPKGTQLFDRYINVSLMRSKSLNHVGDLVFMTPAYGVKPDITISGTFNASQKVHSITVTIKNVDANIDCNAYHYIRIEAGYMKHSFATAFKGQIINCYMAKPNPNGELVINCALADISQALATNNFRLAFSSSKYTMSTFLKYINIFLAAQTGVKKSLITIDSKNIPPAWEHVTVPVSGTTYQFPTLLNIISWMNSLFLAIGRDKHLNPIFAHLENDKIVIKGMFTNNGTVPVLKTIYGIGSAFISGTSVATVSAPFNPDIKVGDYVYFDPKYFKTRVVNPELMSDAGSMTAGFVGSLLGKKLGAVWCVNQMQVTFSTVTANNMVLQMTNVNESVQYIEEV